MGYKRSIIAGITIFSIVIIIALSTFYMSLGSCSEGSFSCDEGKICVAQKLICNKSPDCEDNSDENNTTCGNFHGYKKPPIADHYRSIVEKLKRSNLTAEQMGSACIFDIKQYPVFCSCLAKNYIFCPGRHLIKFPDKLPEKVVGLHLEHNNIRVKPNEVLHWNELKYLNLQNNSLSYISPGLFSNLSRLKKLYLMSNKLVAFSEGVFSNLTKLEWLFLDDNRLTDFDLSEFSGLMNLRWLNLSYNALELRDAVFPNLTNLHELNLDGNCIHKINPELFRCLLNLSLLSLRENKIEVLNSSTFDGLQKLEELRLSNNKIRAISTDFFKKLPNLDALYLDSNNIKISEELLKYVNVSYLSLRHFEYKEIDFKAISKIGNLKHIVYERLYHCSMTPHVRICRPKTDGVSTSDDLLSKPSLRYATWIMAFVCGVGNVLVLWGRYRDENRSVSIVIRNLAVADMLMAIYLFIIAIQDLRFRQKYSEMAIEWMNSWSCTIAGILAMVSSEVSMLILAFMSVERFLLIADPFGGHRRLNTHNIIICLFTIWLCGLSIAIMPVILWRTGTKYYGVYSGTCFPLFIQDRFPPGWEYSAFVFLGVNLTLLILIATLYTALLFSIWRTRKATPLSLFDCEFAIRFFFIVLTDSSCWVPIIILKILALCQFDVPVNIYAWLVVFILPLNASINPLLYTFTTPKYRDQIFTNFHKASFRNSSSTTKRQEILTNSNSKGKASSWN